MSHKPYLRKFVINKLQEAETNLSPEVLVRFWNAKGADFEIGDGGKLFIEQLKDYWDEGWKEKRWQHESVKALSDIDHVLSYIKINKKSIALDDEQIRALRKGYVFAVTSISIGVISAELNEVVKKAKKGKKKDEAQKAFRAYAQKAKEINGYVLADFGEEVPPSPRRVNKDDLWSNAFGSTDESEKDKEPDNVIDATLQAIAKGGKGDLQAVIETYYDKDADETDAAALLPKDQWDTRKATLDGFTADATKALDEMYLFKDEHRAIKSGIYNLFEYIEKLPSTAQGIKLGSKELTFTIQKSGGDKQEGLKDFVREFTRARSLDYMEALIQDQLISRDKEDGLLANRGPIGGYWIGSFFKWQRNPEDGKFANSTTESKLISLLDEVRAQQKLVVELGPNDSSDAPTPIPL